MTPKLAAVYQRAHIGRCCMMWKRWAVLIGLFLLCADAFAFDEGRFRQLRDQGIMDVGWVSGNASKHPIWAELEPFLGRGGTYYEAFVSLKTPSGDAKTEAYGNVALHREWFKIGEGQPFNEDECISKIQRAQQLSAELTEMMDEALEEKKRGEDMKRKSHRNPTRQKAQPPNPEKEGPKP